MHNGRVEAVPSAGAGWEECMKLREIASLRKFLGPESQVQSGSSVAFWQVLGGGLVP